MRRFLIWVTVFTAAANAAALGVAVSRGKPALDCLVFASLAFSLLVIAACGRWMVPSVSPGLAIRTVRRRDLDCLAATFGVHRYAGTRPVRLGPFRWERRWREGDAALRARMVVVASVFPPIAVTQEQARKMTDDELDALRPTWISRADWLAKMRGGR